MAIYVFELVVFSSFKRSLNVFIIRHIYLTYRTCTHDISGAGGTVTVMALRLRMYGDR